MPQPNTESKVEQLRQHIGDVIKAARTGQGLNQVEVAAKAGTSPSRVSELENGRADSRISTLVRVAEVLGVHVTVEARARRTRAQNAA